MATIRDKILIVDDESSSNYIASMLGANNYDTIVARSGGEAYSMIASHCPDLVILDIGLSDMDGIGIIKSIREWSSLPIVVVSSRSSERDKVLALDTGADDYVTKPFGTGELLARIRAALRHTRAHGTNGSVAQSGVFRAGGLTIDYDKHQVQIDGKNANLTQNEYKIVSILGKFAGKVMTYDYLLRELWGPSARGNNQILRVNMANIRRKLEKNPAEPAYIFTEVGVGYRLVDGD